MPSLSNAPGIVAIFSEFVRRYPRRFGVLFAALVFDGLLATCTVLAIVPLADFMLDPALKAPSRITRALLDAVVATDLAPGFWLFGLLFVGVNLAKGLSDIAIRYCVLRVKYTLERGLISDVLTSFFRARWEFFSNTDHGRLMNTLNRELDRIGSTLGYVATQLAAVVQLLIYLTVPLWLNAPMTLTALALALLLGSPLFLLQKLNYRLGQANVETGNAVSGILNETLDAARLVLGFGRQTQSRDRVLAALDRHIPITMRSQLLGNGVGAMFQPIGILSAIVALGIAFGYGAPVAEMAALLWSLLRALPLVGGLMSARINLTNFMPSYEQLASLHAEANALEEIPGEQNFVALEHGIELRDVHFSYRGRSPALQDVSVMIRKGCVTALVGESGSGKSTVTDLLLGLQVPTHGSVLLDGKPLEQWNQNTFRERIGYVPQDPFLFHASIRDNLLWSKADATEEDLWRACRLANAEPFLRQLPEGLDTVVGDRGMRLSGGQRQRIALGRALLRNPELLILDEATSSLDSESERLIQEAINELARDTTLLIVAHRLSTITRADQIYVLHGGRIVESGAYQDLSKKTGGVLAGMISAQQLKTATAIQS
jgi:ATP-binding cassette subfamily B protein